MKLISTDHDCHHSSQTRIYYFIIIPAAKLFCARNLWLLQLYFDLEDRFLKSLKEVVCFEFEEEQQKVLIIELLAKKWILLGHGTTKT